jgi:hypothetical protein
MARKCMLFLVWAVIVACTPAPSNGPLAPPDVVFVDAGASDCAAARALDEGRMIRVASDAALAPVLVVPCP